MRFRTETGLKCAKFPPIVGSRKGANGREHQDSRPNRTEHMLDIPTGNSLLRVLAKAEAELLLPKFESYIRDLAIFLPLP